MASSSKQRKIDHENSTEGYIHAVTPVKISRNGHKYFNAKIQEKQDVTDMVCFQGEDVQEKMAQLAKKGMSDQIFVRHLSDKISFIYSRHI